MLNRIALRLATVYALRGQTYAGSRVTDSDLAPIEEIAAPDAAAATPTVSVYTDDAHFRNAGRSLFDTSGDHRHDVGFQRLVIEFALSKRVQVLDELTGQRLEEAMPIGTDASVEFTLDMIERQVKSALMAPHNAWADMWRRFAVSVGDHESKRGQGARDGVRFAGRQLTIHCKMPQEPEPLPEADMWPLWRDFLALAGTEPSLAGHVVPALRSALVGGPVEDWDKLQGLFGLTTAETRALGHGPLTAQTITGAP